MSLRAQLTILALVVALLFAVAGGVFFVSVGRLDAAETSQREYAVYTREIITLRDIVFDYIETRDPADAARVADKAAFIAGQASRAAQGSPDSQERAELERIAATLVDMVTSARRLSLGIDDPQGAASREELERGLYSQATEVSASLSVLERRSEAVTAREVELVRITAGIAILVGFTLVLGAIVRLAARLRRGLSALTSGLRAFAAGDLEARIELSGRDELSSAADGFNHMADLVSERDREMSDLNRRLVASARTKSEFVANMSHDLRTPLNSIIGFSGVLLSGMAGPLDDEQTRQVRFINRSGEHLKSLVDDVLDLSRLESIGWDPRPRRFSLEMLVQDIADTVHSSATAKKVTVACAVVPAGAEVVADELGCRRILMNLAGNAVKFTEKGSVAIRARVDERTLTLEVEDTGPGVAPDDRARIFEPFEQVEPHDAAVARAEGSGLGLAIVRRIVASLNGTLELESEPGKGSRFTVTLPTGAATASEQD
ncbi:MAG: HAMP domain-containing sensor histidine kinase [Coriobacteriia bacterium]|nr:HAMP domain-containing sensor histidine kinase [Coriobacteriia bacterium]